MQLTSRAQLLLVCVVVLYSLVSLCEAVHSSNRRGLRSSVNKNELMRQFRAAAASGDLELTKQVQKKLLQVDVQMQKQKHRRRMLQDDCAALSETDLAACASFDCVSSGSALERQASGDIICVTPEGSDSVDVSDFIYFLPYDYDALWDTDADNVLGGASATTTLSNTNELTSSAGNIGYDSRFETATNNRAVPFPFLGIRADSEGRADVIQANFEVGTSPQVPLSFTGTSNPGVTAEGTLGAYLPGTTATPREVADGGTEDNVAFTVRNLGVLSGYTGR